MIERNNKSTFIIIIGLIFWILYLCDAEMSRYGIYTIFSYSTHELLSAVPILCLIITICWLILILVRKFRKNNFKSDLFLSILLIILSVSQIVYLYNQSQTVLISCGARIERIDTTQLEIVIKTDERSVTLNCPMLAQSLIRADGTEYGITYEQRKSDLYYGKLCMIQLID